MLVRAGCGVNIAFKKMNTMICVDIVGLLAVLQLVLFGILVGRARGRYDIAAPPTSGHPLFERYYRIQMTTVESLLLFMPRMVLSATYWTPGYSDLLGVGDVWGRCN